jgi:hypothetical protein
VVDTGAIGDHENEPPGSLAPGQGNHYRQCTKEETAMSTAPFPVIADADTREQPTKTRASEHGRKPPDDHRPQVGRLQRLLGTCFRDALFERPDLIEDDYYRMINQPRGW